MRYIFSSFQPDHCIKGNSVYQFFISFSIGHPLYSVLWMCVVIVGLLYNLAAQVRVHRQKPAKGNKIRFNLHLLKGLVETPRFDAKFINFVLKIGNAKVSAAPKPY